MGPPAGHVAPAGRRGSVSPDAARPITPNHDLTTSRPHDLDSTRRLTGSLSLGSVQQPQMHTRRPDRSGFTSLVHGRKMMAAAALHLRIAFTLIVLAGLAGSLFAANPQTAGAADTPRRGGVLLAVIGADAPSLDCHQES